MIRKLATAFLATVLLATLPALAAGPLDGKSFHGTLTETGKKGNGDNFEFKDGQFRSTACERDGFHYGKYTAEGSGASTTFSAQVTGKKGGTMDWKGTVSGDTVSGTAVLTQTGKPPINFTFEGKVKPMTTAKK